MFLPGPWPQVLIGFWRSCLSGSLVGVFILPCTVGGQYVSRQKREYRLFEFARDILLPVRVFAAAFRRLLSGSHGRSWNLSFSMGVRGS